MLVLFSTVTILLLGNIQAFTQRQANEYIESVLSDRFVEEAKYSRLDPYKLEDITVAVNHTGKQRGSALLSKGQLINLSRVRRAFDCSEPQFVSANVSFSCFLTFDQLRINYTANATFDNINVIFYPHVTIKGTNVTLRVTSNRHEDVPTMVIMLPRVGTMNVTALMISIGDSAQIVGIPVREALVKYSIKNLHIALNNRFKNALAYSIYKTPFGFLSN